MRFRNDVLRLTGCGALALIICAFLLLAPAACVFAQCVETGPAQESPPQETAAPAPPEEGTPTPSPSVSKIPNAPPEPGAELQPPRFTGLEPDGTFGEKTLFIGDSLTAALISYLRMTDRLGTAKYMAICTYPLQSFFGAPFLDSYSAQTLGMDCSAEFYGCSFAEAVRKAGENVGAVYFMLGTNQSREVTPENYTEVLTWIRSCCPNASIYAQTIPYSAYHISDYDSVNAVVRKSVAALRSAGDEQIFVLDTFAALGTDYLRDDGLHLTPDGLKVWYRYLAGEPPV